MVEAAIYVPTTPSSSPARSYNQLHVARKPTPGRRRVSIYVSWSYPAEERAMEYAHHGDALVPRQQRFGR